MDNRNQDFSEGVYQLAERCEVGIGAACRRAGISPATPPRWKNGTRPRPVQLRKLRRVIIEIAKDQGTLPSDVAVEPPAVTDSISEDLRAIIAIAQRAEAKVGRA